MPAAPAPLLPESLWRWGSRLLTAAFGMGMLVTLYLTWANPDLLLLLPIGLLAGVIGFVLVRRPLLNLSLVLGGFVIIAAHKEGFQITEVLYGLYALGYLAAWLVGRLFFYRDRILDDPEDKALFLFLAGVVLSFPLTFLFGGRPSALVSEMTAMAMLAFFFPVKDACQRFRNGPHAILIVIAWIGLFICVRNLITYQAVLANATMAWQIIKGRVVVNDHLLMVSTVFALVFLVFARGWRQQILLLGLFLLSFLCLILTQSRGYWVAFAVGAIAMYWLIERRYRRKVFVLGLAGVFGLVGVGLLFFSDYVLLIFGGLLTRFSSLSTATTQDVSLVNRFRETAAVWAEIQKSPILGHGMGVSYHFYDLTYDATRVDTFNHNGYISLWYRFGIWGLGLLLFVWARSTWNALVAFRTPGAERVTRIGALAAGLCLFAFILPVNTSNPFFLSDGTFIFALLMGLASGLRRRAELESAA